MDSITFFTNPYIFLSSEGLLVEGCARICQWQSECIILNAKGRIKITGERLSLDLKGQGVVLIKGKILSLEFEK